MNFFLLSFIQEIRTLKRSEKYFFGLVLLDLLLLLFLGKNYTKFSIFSYLFLHDVVISALCLASFYFKPRVRVYAIEILIIISLLYLLFSIINIKGELYLVIRQYMVFGYIMISYFITKTIYNFKNGFLILRKTIIIIGLSSLFIQLLYVVFLLLTSNSDVFHPFSRIYLSPLVILGVIISGAYVMTHYIGYKKQLYFIFVVIISFTFGHDSAYLSLIIIYFAYFFITSNLKGKLILGLTTVLSVLLFLIYIPSFTDVNMSWRIIYWKNIIRKMALDYSIFYGNGFGVFYLNEETRHALNNLMTSNGHSNILTLREKHLTAPHNSFITIIFHLGIINFILLLIPIKTLIHKPIRNMKSNDNDVLFLTLSLIGVSILASFNLTLELPHSSFFFWIVYFTLVLRLKNEKNNSNLQILINSE